MTAALARSLLIVLTILGVTLPRVSAAVASLAPGAETVVICTGDGLRTIRIGADGTPVQVSHQTDHCLLTQAADTAVRIDPAPAAGPLVDTVPRRPGDLVRRSGQHAARPPPRGPPAA